MAQLQSCSHVSQAGLALPTDSVITPETVYEVMEDDMAVADLVLWVGISFEQSASTQYFRNVSPCGLRRTRTSLTFPPPARSCAK